MGLPRSYSRCFLSFLVKWSTRTSRHGARLHDHRDTRPRYIYTASCKAQSTPYARGKKREKKTNNGDSPAAEFHYKIPTGREVEGHNPVDDDLPVPPLVGRGWTFWL